MKEQEATIASLNEKLEYTKASLQAENHAVVLKKDKEIKKCVLCSVRLSQCECMHVYMAYCMHICDRILENHPYGRILHFKYLDLKSRLKFQLFTHSWF